jgi:integrase
MGAIYEHHKAFFWRVYSSVNVQTGSPIIDSGDGTPLRENGRLAVRSLARQPDGQPRFRRLVSAAGKPIKLQQSVKLADVDTEHYWADEEKTVGSLALNILAQQKDKQITKWEKAGANVRVRPDAETLIDTFFNTVYLPWAEVELEASTVRSYKVYWTAYLRDAMRGRTFADYEVLDGGELLDTLAGEYSECTVKHVRSLASGIWSHAVTKGFAKYNIWRDVKQTVTGIEVEDTYAYNQKEVEQIIAALDQVTGQGQPLAQTASMCFSVGYYSATRPSECCALRWENVDLVEGKLHINHAYVQGVFKGTKTDENRTLPLAPKLLTRFKLWAMLQGHPTTGWVFPNGRGNAPVDMAKLGSRVVAAVCKAHGFDWHGWYACRRGGITAMILAGATPLQAAKFAGHSVAVLEKNYLKDKKHALAAEGSAKWVEAMNGEAGGQKTLTAGGGR